jgi:hypothetical protein
VFLFESRAVIRHRVPEARCRFDYFRSRCYAEGLSKALVTRSVGTAAGLSAERSYTTVTLRRGVSRGLLRGIRGDAAALARAAAIIVGLLCASTGYAVGAIQHRLSDVSGAAVS